MAGTNKSVAGISAVMNDQKLASLISDASNSKLGSVKRKKAASILRSVRRATGYSGQAVVPNTYDGQGGPANIQQPLEVQPEEFETTVKKYTDSGIPLAEAQTRVNELFSKRPGFVPQPITRGYAGTPVIFEAAPKPKDTSALPSFTSLPEPKTTYDMQPQPMQPGEFEATVKKYTDAGVPLVEAQTRVKGLFAGRPAGPTMPSATPSGMPPEVKFADSSEFYDNWYAGLPETDKTRWKPLYEALKAGVGPKTFAWNVQQNVEDFKKMFPNVPDEMLPQGASLARQYVELKKSEKEKFKVDELSNNLSTLQKRGLTIERDLQGYVTARDKYIANLDTLIEKGKDTMLTADMANPYVKQRMDNYMNYLYIMKGRQQKRYSDFLKVAIDQHNSEVATAKSAYESTYAKFKDELEDLKEVKKEDYDRLNSMLEEMYTNVVKREENQYKSFKNYVDLLKAQSDLSNTVLDLESGMSKSDRESSEQNYLTANPGKTSADWKALSSDDKKRWVKKDGGGIAADINFYTEEIGNRNPTYWDDKKGEPKWGGVPAALRAEVQKKWNEALAALPEEQPSWFKRALSAINPFD